MRRLLIVAIAAVAGARITSVATFWTGPEGAFYREGGLDEQRVSQPVVTDARGMAAVCSAEVLADEARAQINATRSSAWYGGGGPTRAGAVREVVVVADRPGWPRATVRAPWFQTGGPLEIVFHR